MNKKIYMYSDFCENFFSRLFLEYKIINLSNTEIQNDALVNKNIILIINEKKPNIKEFKQSFFTKNNVLIFSSKKENENLKLNNLGLNFFYGPAHIKKFLDFSKNFFVFGSTKFKDLEITGETLKNISTQMSCSLTALEKQILLELFDINHISRDYFLEELLKIKKNIETKTVESHLSRIRKKLIQIKSNIQISSKEDGFYFDSN